MFDQFGRCWDLIFGRADRRTLLFQRGWFVLVIFYILYGLRLDGNFFSVFFLMAISLETTHVYFIYLKLYKNEVLMICSKCMAYSLKLTTMNKFQP